MLPIGRQLADARFGGGTRRLRGPTHPTRCLDCDWARYKLGPRTQAGNHHWAVVVVAIHAHSFIDAMVAPIARPAFSALATVRSVRVVDAYLGRRDAHFGQIKQQLETRRK